MSSLIRVVIVHANARENEVPGDVSATDAPVSFRWGFQRFFSYLAGARRRAAAVKSSGPPQRESGVWVPSSVSTDSTLIFHWEVAHSPPYHYT